LRSLVKAVSLVFLGTVLSSVSIAQKVKYNFDQGAEFSKFKTYKWQRAEKAKYDDPMVDRILKSTIVEQPPSKGLTKTEDYSADLYVIYQLAVAQDVEWSTYNTGIDWYSGANNLAGFRGGTTNATTIIRKGWLMIDLYDAGQKKLVWQANAVKTLGKGQDPNKMERNARKAMGKIFKKYPPSRG